MVLLNVPHNDIIWIPGYSVAKRAVILLDVDSMAFGKSLAVVLFQNLLISS